MHLARIMENCSAAKQSIKKLLDSVVHSIRLFSAPIRTNDRLSKEGSTLESAAGHGAEDHIRLSNGPQRH